LAAVALLLLHSRWVTALKKLGVSFFWGFIFALIFGAVAFYRLDRSELKSDASFISKPRIWIEQLELYSYDWRVTALGSTRSPSDDVVLVVVDDETVSNGRESGNAMWGMRPWPRELWAQVSKQLLLEGAKTVVVDSDFSDVSSHRCEENTLESDDDLKFGAFLEACGERCILSAQGTDTPRRPPEKPLRPFLVLLKKNASENELFSIARSALTRGASAFTDADGGVWAGLASEEEAKRFARQFGEVRGTNSEVGVSSSGSGKPKAEKIAVVRALTAGDDEFEISAETLAVGRLNTNLQVPLESLEAVSSVDYPVLQLLRAGGTLGLRNIVPDLDGVVRAAPLLQASRGLPVVAAQALRAAASDESKLAEQPIAISPNGLTIGSRTVPTDAHHFLNLVFDDDEVGRDRGTVKRSLSAWRVLVNSNDELKGRTLRRYENDLKGKTVILTDLRESKNFKTPVGTMSNAAILAQTILNIRQSQGIVRVEPRIDFWITVSYAFLGSLLALAWSSLFRRPGWLAWVLTIAGLFVVHGFFARQLFVTQMRSIVFVAPVLAGSLSFLASLGYARTLEQRLREFVSRALGGAVRSDVASRVERDLALMRPERRPLTIYFSDIEGFTSVSNQRSPEVMVKVLRTHLEMMTEEVINADGHVDKYLGDGVMAFWGAPVSRADDAQKACAAALSMQAAFEKKRPEFETICDHALTLRCGIELGDSIVGEMGTAHHLNYTVMGEPVSTAFRLEAMAKKYEVHILCGPKIVAVAKDSFVFREVDSYRGLRDARVVRMYELMGTAAVPWISEWETAMELYRSRKFLEAKAKFSELQVAQPDDSLTKRYVARCERLARQTVAISDFDGIYPYEEKA
jgi:adenylate cyclase